MALILVHLHTVRENRQYPLTHTLPHTNADPVIDWYGTVNKEFLSVFWIMSGAGRFWMSFRQKRQCGCLRERETENKGKERIKHGNSKHSGREERTVWTLQLPAGLHCAAQEPHWSDKAIKYEHTSSEWSDWSQPKVEPNNFSCLDEASRVFGWRLDEPACLSGQRTNCDTRCERRRQRSGERGGEARS